MKHTRVLQITLLMLSEVLALAVAQQPQPTPPPGLPPDLALKLRQQQKTPPVTGTAQATPAPAASAAPTAPAPDTDRWNAFMNRYYDVKKFPKTFAVRISPTVARPLKHSDIKMEIVGGGRALPLPAEPPGRGPRVAAHKAWLYHESQEAFLR